MILSEAIEYCEDIARKCELGESPMVGSDEHWQITKWLKELKKYEEKDINVPLAWEELKQMQGKPIWIETNENKFWDVVSEVTNNHLICIHCLPMHKCWQGKEDGWQAYRKERE